MTSPIGLLSLAAEKARYTAARQSVIAENVANADTPGYRAKDVEPFSQFLARAQTQAGSRDDPTPATVERTAFGAASPDLNTVSLETEMMNAGQAAREHDTAVAIYAKAIGFLKTALGRIT